MHSHTTIMFEQHVPTKTTSVINYAVLDQQQDEEDITLQAQDI